MSVCLCVCERNTCVYMDCVGRCAVQFHCVYGYVTVCLHVCMYAAVCYVCRGVQTSVRMHTHAHVSGEKFPDNINELQKTHLTENFTHTGQL